MSRAQCDVLVLGGGAAGLATAIELRQASGLNVVVAEPRASPAERFGETLAPDVAVAIGRLGVRDAFRADGHLPCPGNVSLWGSDRPGHSDFVLSPLGPGWHISRARLEAMLRARAAGCGAALRGGARAVAAAPADDGFDVTLRQAGGDCEVVRASWVVDATGWRAWFARRQGARRCHVERLVAIVRLATVRSGTFTAQTVVEATPDGWWYAARLPGDRLTTVFLTAPAAARSVVGGGYAGWRALLAQTQLLAPRLAECELADERLRPHAAPSGRLDRAAGERWLAVGDAAAAYDPIVGRGIAAGLGDARAAAAAILGALGHRPQPASPYGQHVAARFDDYAAHRAQLYARERRWPTRPFWRARGRIELAAASPGAATPAMEARPSWV